MKDAAFSITLLSLGLDSTTGLNRLGFRFGLWAEVWAPAGFRFGLDVADVLSLLWVGLKADFVFLKIKAR